MSVAQAKPPGHANAGRPSRLRRIARAIGIVAAVVTGIVAVVTSLNTIYGWLAPYVPLASRLSDAHAVTGLAPGVQLSLFDAALGDYAARKEDGPFAEYIYVRRNCYVQAITHTNDERVLLFTVVTRNGEFQPVFDSPSQNGLTEPVRLGVTTFAEVSEPDWIGGWFGASWANYVEYTSLPHADNFRSVIVGQCDAGHCSVAPYYDEFPEDALGCYAPTDTSSAQLADYRSRTPVNTYGEAAPGFSPAELYDEHGLPRYEIIVGLEPSVIPDVGF